MAWEEMISTILLREVKEEKNKNFALVNGSEKLFYFLKTVKLYSILGYTTSEYFMTAIMPYKMAPGKFNGSIPINEQDKVNLYG